MKEGLKKRSKLFDRAAWSGHPLTSLLFSRWYLRRYFIWTILSHVTTFAFGFYSNMSGNDAVDQTMEALEICRRVQAVQMLPFWSVELFDIEPSKAEKEE